MVLESNLGDFWWVLGDASVDSKNGSARHGFFIHFENRFPEDFRKLISESKFFNSYEKYFPKHVLEMVFRNMLLKNIFRNMDLENVFHNSFL